MKERVKWKKFFVAQIAFFFVFGGPAPPFARGYAFNYVVADMRLPAAESGGSACPVPAHLLTGAGSINRRWSTTLNTNPVTILTADQTPAGRLNEIETVIQDSFSTWSSVSGTSLTSTSLGPLGRTGLQNACAADGVNSICFNQSDAPSTPGVLAFTRVIVADRIGETVGSATSTAIGQILDADIESNPGDSRTTFATPAALAEFSFRVRPAIGVDARTRTLPGLQPLGRVAGDDVPVCAAAGNLYRRSADDAGPRRAAFE